jgi:glycosyltransferase involved in cell wall biosynthesis
VLVHYDTTKYFAFILSMTRPFFSIVTPALNCARYLPRNFASIASQGLPTGEIEHWVIDGGSNDGTLELLQQQGNVRYISEKDRGLSDAVNKGICRATGEWIIWLNADDELAPEALLAFQRAVRQYPGVCIFCGGQDVLDYDGRLESISDGWDYNARELLGERTAILQASTFVHRSVYDKVGLLDVNIRYAMDYEWTVRAVHHFRCQSLPIILTRYHRRRGSIMDAHMADHFREFLRQRRKYGQPRLSIAEFNIRFFIYTDWLRQIGSIRRAVRRLKRLFGREPIHPIS